MLANKKLSRNGCDAIDLSALWPCTAQIGWIPITEMLLRERSVPETDDEK